MKTSLSRAAAATIFAACALLVGCGEDPAKYRAAYNAAYRAAYEAAYQESYRPAFQEAYAAARPAAYEKERASRIASGAYSFQPVALALGIVVSLLLGFALQHGILLALRRTGWLDDLDSKLLKQAGVALDLRRLRQIDPVSSDFQKWGTV